MAPRAAIYARISDDRTGEKAGVKRQHEDAIRLCDRRGWEPVLKLVDNDLTASRFARKRRPAYDELVAAVEAGEIDAIAAFHTDRLYRQPKELEALIDLVEARSLLIATCEGDFDLGTSDGRAMARVLVAIAAKESDDKSRRILRKHEALAAEGRVGGGGRRPFGYEADRVTIRPDEAAAIREAAERVLAGDSVRSVLHHWRRTGIETVTGAAWSSTSVKRVLISARIAGLREHRGLVKGRAVWPAIIDQGTHTRLRAVLSDPARNRLAGVSARRYLLAGLLHCGRCGAVMGSRPTARGKSRYVCVLDRGGCGRCGISAEYLEADVTAALLAMVDTGKVRARRQLVKSSGIESDLVADIAEAEAELKLLATDFAERRIGRDGYMATVAAIEQRLTDRRRALTKHRAQQVATDLTADADPVKAWEGLSFDRRRAVLADKVSRIEVAPTSRQQNFYDFERVEITWA